MFDLFREIAQVMRMNRTRTILTGIAVSWGILMLIILVSMGHGVLNSFRNHADDPSNRSLGVYPGYTSKSYDGLNAGRWIRLDIEDIAGIENDPAIKSSAVYASIRNNVRVQTGRDYVDQGMFGVFPKFLLNEDLELLNGRLINQNDNDGRRKVMLLHKNAAERLFGSVDKAIGQTTDAFGLGWTVIGVYDHFWRIECYVPFRTLAGIMSDKPNISQFTVMIEDIDDVDESKAQVDAVRANLGRAHRFAADDNGAVWIANRLENLTEALTALGIMQAAIWLIGLMSLISGIVGVSNIMFVSVRERTHEIGIRRAIGAKPRSILTQILLESVCITGLFGYIGIVSGAIVMEVANRLIKGTEVAQAIRNPTVDIDIAISVTVVLIVSGMLAGLFPAIKALKVKPVEALRDE